MNHKRLLIEGCLIGLLLLVLAALGILAANQLEIIDSLARLAG